MQSDKPEKLLYLITDLKFGGAQTVLLYLVKYLNRTRFTPQVACLFGGDSPVAEALHKMGIPVTDLRMTHPWRVDALWRFYRLLKQERIAILHASLFHANIIARLIGKLAQIPIIITWRQNVSIGGRWRDYFNRLTAVLDDRVVAVSEPSRQAELATTKVAKDKVELIYNCIDIEHYSFSKRETLSTIRDEFGISHEAIVIGFVGRLHPQKAIDVLLRAFAKIEFDKQDVRLLIVGDGKLDVQLKELAESLAISRHVIFAGIRNNIANVLASLDIFVLPSLWEGLPLALLEAMASQLPVVVTPVGGVPDVVVDGESGFIVPTQDSDALANAVNKLINNPNLRESMGVAGRLRVIDHFSAQEVVKKLSALYEELLVEKMAT